MVRKSLKKPSAQAAPPQEVAKGAQKPKQAKPSKKSSEQKWGKKVIDRGFLVVPSLILRAQRELKISGVQLAILLHLADHWWEKDRMPHPGKGTLAHRMGLSERQVQRQIKELEKLGLVERCERTAKSRGKLTNAYDLTGLVEKLQEIEPAFRKTGSSSRVNGTPRSAQNEEQYAHLRK